MKSIEYKYLGVLQAEVQMNKEMKEKVEKEYLRRVKLLARSKLYAGNLVRGINAWAIGVVRYSAGIIDWTEGDLKKMDVKTRKTLSMAGAFHTRGSSLRLYIKRKEGGKGLISVEDCVKMERANLKSYVSESEEWLLKEVASMELVKSVESGTDYKKRIEAERKETLRSKPLHGKFFNVVEGLAEEGVVDLDRSRQWLKAGFLTKSTEGFIMAAQEQALRTKGVKASIDKVEGEDGLCRLCGKFQESVQHIVSSCGELAKKQYTIRHDKMGSRIHWELCRKYGIKCEDKWFNHVPSTVCSDDNGNIEIFWNKEIDLGVPHNRPDVVVVDKEEKKWTLIDFSVPWDGNVKSKEDEKITKYAPLEAKIQESFHVQTESIPIIVGALGTIPSRLLGFLKAIGLPDVIGSLQTSALLGTQRILRNTLAV